MAKIVPLISSQVVGPLGLAHLPRFWLKTLLSTAGMLYDGSVSHKLGFNLKMLGIIGVEPEGCFAFLKTLPTYPQTEAYIAAHASDLTPATIAASNDAICGACAEINEDDWNTAHDYLLSQRGSMIEPLLPAVSASTAGPLGIPYLPRLWYKTLLRAVGALAMDGPLHSDFDQLCAAAIGFDLADANGYVQLELPTYEQFEYWICTNAPSAEGDRQSSKQ